MRARKDSQKFWTRLQVANKPGEELSRWINEDIRPLPPSRRQWTNATYISWWTVWMLGISNWQVGAALVAAGLSVWQTMVAIIIGRLITAAVAIGTGFPGAEWHIGFPVTMRMVWGLYGAYIPILLRVTLSLIGFAVQSWIGGLCITAMLSGLFPSFHRMRNTLLLSANTTTAELVGWIVFNFATLPILYKRPERAARLFTVMNLISFSTLVANMIRSLVDARGAGPLLLAPTQLHSAR